MPNLELNKMVAPCSLGRPRIAVAFGIVLSSALLACGGSRPPDEALSQPVALSVDSPLRPGDAVQVSFSREPGLNGQFAIDETGTVSLPLIGDMAATDLPAGEFKTILEGEYSARTRNQSVQVVYLRRIRVLGEVRNPGIYHADPTMALDDIVALAGGAEPDGNLTKVSLVRDGVEVEANLDLRQGAAVDLDSGDQIFVPKTSWFSRNAAVLIGATISAIGVIVAFAN
jgi:polysaccharide export outer membrane protein